MDNPLTIFGGFAGIGVLAAGFGFAYAQFRSGASKAQNELITTLQETASAEKIERIRLAEEKTSIIASHQDAINKLNADLGKLRGLFEASEKEKQNYLSILQGRSPEQEAYMHDMREFTKGVAKYMLDSSEILASMKEFMTTLNKKANENQRWNERVDNDTQKEEGKTLRKKI